ncbi:unnamed protein product, partial [Prorocentrum cordatum]
QGTARSVDLSSARSAARAAAIAACALGGEASDKEDEKAGGGRRRQVSASLERPGPAASRTRAAPRRGTTRRGEVRPTGPQGARSCRGRGGRGATRRARRSGTWRGRGSRDHLDAARQVRRRAHGSSQESASATADSHRSTVS